MNDNTQAPLALYTAAQVRELDRQAIEIHGIPAYVLMQRAAEFMFAQLQERYADCQHWLVLCGAGNNAGDGYVIARLASQSGYKVSVVGLKAAEALSGSALQAATDWQAVGGEVIEWTTELDISADLIVDAILGTGLDRPLQGSYLEAVQWLNQQAAVIAAVDIPTGLNADTGVAQKDTVQADICCTFIGCKQGLLTADAQAVCGEVLFDDLAIPVEIYTAFPAAARVLAAEPELLSPRNANSYKGNYGRLLLCGGRAGMSGAILLAGETALRAGAGMVTLATDAEHAALLNLNRPELMVAAVPDSAALNVISTTASVFAIGPGMGTGDWGRFCFDTLVNIDDKRPLVVDADALNLLAEKPLQRKHWVLTPHPGEAGRLLGISATQVQQDRFSAVRQLAEKYQAVVVLKGSGSLVADYKRRNQADEIVVDVCPFGNPGMASAGMGDVLTGLIAALLGQGLACLPAARLAVVVHAQAGDWLAEQEGQLGLLAGDMPEVIRQLLNLQDSVYANQ